MQSYHFALPCRLQANLPSSSISKLSLQGKAK
jgi:hypothetical protein